MRKCILFLVLTAFSFLFPSSLFAEEISNYKTDIVANSDGTMHITETIVYDFGNESRHGIFRTIPHVSKVGDLYRVITLSNFSVLRDNEQEPYAESTINSDTQYKIGNPNRTLTGKHTYELHYIVSNGIGSNYSDHDEIYWNIIGPEWTVPIASSTATIRSDVAPTNTTCYAGSVGSTEKFCTSSIKGSIASFVTTGELPSGDTFSIVASYPVHTFPPSTLQTNQPGELTAADIKHFLIGYGIVWVLLNIVLVFFLIRWYRKTHINPNFGKPAVNFDLPKDDKKRRVTPLEAGIIDNTKLEVNDVIGTIFDLAIRKYLRIENVQDKKFLGIFGGKEDYQLTKLKDPDSHLETYEVTLMNRLFRDGDSVNLSDLKSDFYETFEDMEQDAFRSLVTHKYYHHNPKVQKTLLLLGSIFSFVTLNAILGGVLLWLMAHLNGRLIEGEKLNWQIDGLKIFVKAMDRNFTWHAEQLALVEKMIPYAISLGFIDEFMKQLKLHYPNYQPTWYSGNGNFFVFAGSFNSTFSANITTSAPSSSSGFSSGGFSGGGGGGGGGGSW